MKNADLSAHLLSEGGPAEKPMSSGRWGREVLRVPGSCIDHTKHSLFALFSRPVIEDINATGGPGVDLDGQCRLSNPFQTANANMVHICTINVLHHHTFNI